jgi:hypothetical protein
MGCVVPVSSLKLARREAARFMEAGDGVRTHDPQLGKLMLYQLSYARVGSILAAGVRREIGFDLERVYGDPSYGPGCTQRISR